MKAIIKYFFTSLLAMGLLSSSITYAHAQTAHEQEPAKVAAKAALRAKKADDTTPVNINKANAEELTSLKGIGAKRAEEIIAYRKEHGEFKTVEELAEVKGIGKKGLARIQEHNPGRIVLR